MDFEFPRGDTFSFVFQLLDKNKNVLHLTPGDKLYVTFRKAPNSKTPVLQKTLGNGITPVDNGYFRVLLNSSDTANLQYGDYGYDIELKTNEGIVKTLTIGTMTLTEEYTHKGDEI